MENRSAQMEEVETLKAIYGEDFRLIASATNTQTMSIMIPDSANGRRCINLQVTYPDDYPSDSPPVYELRCSDWLDSSDTQHIADCLARIYRDNQGEVVVYQWVEWIREYVTSKADELTAKEEEVNEEPVSFLKEVEGERHQHSLCDAESTPTEQTTMPCPDIFHGEPLVDRRSTFQAHVAAVTSKQEVDVVIAELKRNRKVATATHNILAYRLYDVSRDVYMQDCDDDGESAAGGRLLHLLQMMDVRNGMVVVSRWFGGLLLHADRFKHINNVARILLQDTGVGTKHKEDIKNAKSKGKRTR